MGYQGIPRSPFWNSSLQVFDVGLRPRRLNGNLPPGRTESWKSKFDITNREDSKLIWNALRWIAEGNEPRDLSEIGALNQRPISATLSDESVEDLMVTDEKLERENMELDDDIVELAALMKEMMF